MDPDMKEALLLLRAALDRSLPTVEWYARVKALLERYP